MNKVLGLLDTLESTVLESKKIPMTDKVIVVETQLIDIIDKIRLVIKSDGDAVENMIDIKKEQQYKEVSYKRVGNSEDELNKAKKIKKGAEEYANYVLTNLQLAVTKMQTNLIKLEKNIESSRKVIDEKNKSINEQTERVEEYNE
ncbi:hypothetical protein DID78_03110 [Candidatus Marinamargulisbacteria bacterium SCGC AG-343-D04]|nr:hypothetical protein DID78_03110 [Candidatus Marinamargulisbacteria bacterium SCGC AG-343-D04]